MSDSKPTRRSVQVARRLLLTEAEVHNDQAYCVLQMETKEGTVEAAIAVAHFPELILNLLQKASRAPRQPPPTDLRTHLIPARGHQFADTSIPNEKALVVDLGSVQLAFHVSTARPQAPQH